MNCPNCHEPIESGHVYCPGCGMAVADMEPEQSCRFCDTVIKPGQRFCTGCGRKAEEALSRQYLCKECGTLLEEDARFCSYCGTSRPAEKEKKSPEIFKEVEEVSYKKERETLQAADADTWRESSSKIVPKPATRPATPPAGRIIVPEEGKKHGPEGSETAPLSGASPLSISLEPEEGLPYKAKEKSEEDPFKSAPSPSITDVIKEEKKEHQEKQKEAAKAAAPQIVSEPSQRPFRRTTILVGDEADTPETPEQKGQPAEAFGVSLEEPVTDFHQLDRIDGLPEVLPEDSSFQILEGSKEELAQRRKALKREVEEKTRLQNGKNGQNGERGESLAQQTPETQRSIEELELLIQQLEIKEAELAVPKQQVEQEKEERAKHEKGSAQAEEKPKEPEDTSAEDTSKQMSSVVLEPSATSTTPVTPFSPTTVTVQDVEEAERKETDMATGHTARQSEPTETRKERKAREKEEKRLEKSGGEEPAVATSTQEDNDFVFTTPEPAMNGEEPAVEPAKPVPPKKKRSPLLFIVVIILIALLVSASLLFVLLRRDQRLQAKTLSSTLALEQSLADQGALALEPEATGSDNPTIATDPVVVVRESESVEDLAYTIDIAIEPTWVRVGSFGEEGITYFAEGEDEDSLLYGLTDRTGKIIAEPQYQAIGEFSQGLARFQQDDHYGFLAVDGAVAIPADFTQAEPFSEGLAAVEVDGAFGYVDTEGVMIILPQYDKALPFSYGFAVVEQDEQSFFIDTTGVAVSDFYSEAHSFSEGFAAVRMGDQWGYLDKSLKTAIPFLYEEAEPFSNGFAVVTLEGKQWLIDTEGEESSPKLDQLFSVTEDGIATAKEGDTYGFVDSQTGEFIIPPQYKDAGNFVSGLAPVQTENGAWHYITPANQVLVSENFQQVDEFSDGLARVKVGADFYIIDRSGNIIDNRVWDDIGSYHGGMLAVKKGGLWGFLSVERVA